jgi:hypothetical protein
MFTSSVTEMGHMLMNHARDMANIDLGWEVDGIMTPQESVSAMIKVIESKGIQHSGTFWTWENKVCDSNDLPGRLPDSCSNTPGKAWLVVPSLRPSKELSARIQPWLQRRS